MRMDSRVRAATELSGYRPGSFFVRYSHFVVDRKEKSYYIEVTDNLTENRRRNILNHKGNTKLAYTQPAKSWVQALPVGNGRLGGMVFGGIAEERIQMNEDSIWYGG
ncbi:MAG: glycoside hydrolase family 95 protein, partial [Paenibacillus sp.]|nr:glycoside hydrolase family 95 protein [Paenibacillus sp.]